MPEDEQPEEQEQVAQQEGEGLFLQQLEQQELPPVGAVEQVLSETEKSVLVLDLLQEVL